MSGEGSGSVGLFAYAVSDPELKFHKFLWQYGIQLGAAGGDILLWRPIGDPAQCDQEYQKLRTEEQRQADHDQSEQFRAEVDRKGSEAWHLNQQYLQYAENLGVGPGQAPLVVLGAPQFLSAAGFRIPIEVFDTPKGSRALASLLCSELSVESLTEMRREGFFYDSSMFELKRFSNRLALKIIQLVDRHTTKLTSDKELHFNDQTQVRPIDPATETRLRWKITGEGHLIVAGDSDGGFKAKVEFRAFPQATRQQNLFHFLLDRYPADVSLADCFQAAYQEEYDNGALNEDPARYLKSLRALFSDLDKKLVKEGFPKGLLPKVSVDRGIAFPVRIIAREVLESSSFSGD